MHDGRDDRRRRRQLDARLAGDAHLGLADARAPAPAPRRAPRPRPAGLRHRAQRLDLTAARSGPSQFLAPRCRRADRRGIPRGPGPGRYARPGERLRIRVTTAPSGGDKAATDLALLQEDLANAQESRVILV